jgi:tRNA (guanine37-N1)-methyltransferase
MKIDIITLFPSMFTGPFDTSMLKKAKDNGMVKINIHDLRDWTTDAHRTTDDRSYGGGPGMVLMVEPIDKALKSLKTPDSIVILLSPQGEIFSQPKARDLALKKHIIFLSGHYEGFDERIREHLIDEEISIGKYVLTGGELPAMVITDAIVRLLPGVLEEEASSNESFSEGDNLDFPVYTRPEEYNGWKVPEVLLGGNHKQIKEWRQQKAEEKTKSRLR